jgi:predicted lipoprotein with Yx(FWY)xxD motif
LTRGRLAVAALSALSAMALLAAGCGSSSSSSSDGGSTGAKASAASVKVTTMKITGYGTVLAAGGRPVYLHSSDPEGKSACAAACAAKWPPLTAGGTPGAGPGVKSSLLATFQRDDGKRQVLYGKHALYTHKGRGLVSGAGVSSDGGTWYLVSPAGQAITATTSGGY